MKALALAAALFAAPVWAYTVGTAFTAACHEELTAAAFTDAVLRAAPSPAERSAATRRLMAQYRSVYGREGDDEATQWLLMSLIVGVREPDGEGFSPTDLVSTRPIQLAEDAQYRHALRRGGDDGEAGDAVALEGMRTELQSLLQATRDSLAKPADEQVLTVTAFIADYGRIQLEVWAPAYFTGRAAHLLQDSFSHSLRSDDLQRIRHVFNFVDALKNDFDEPRDGHRHSSSLDTCTEPTRPLTEAATRATRDLFAEALGPGGGPSTAVTWLQQEPGCTVSNEYCASPWLPLAVERLSYPVLGCHAAGESLMALLSLMWLLRSRRS